MKSFLSNKRREAKSEKRRQQINERSSPSKEGKLFRPTDSLLQLQLLPFVRMKIAQLFLIPSEKKERERASEELNFVPIPTDFWMWSLAEMHIVELRMKRQSDKSKATTILSSSLLYAASSLAGFFSVHVFVNNLRHSNNQCSIFLASRSISSLLICFLLRFAACTPERMESELSSWIQISTDIDDSPLSCDVVRAHSTVCTVSRRVRPPPTNIYDYKVVVNIKIIQQSSRWE